MGGGGSRVVEFFSSDSDTETVDFDAGFGHVEDSVGAARHASDDALGESADIFGQAGEPGCLVGDLEKLAQIQRLAGDLINHGIGLFLG